jgi:hypothetical protein
MKRFLLVTVFLVIGSQLAFAAQSTGGFPYFPTALPFDSSSTRDAFGYGWVDNDGGGGPTYNWIDITQIGTQVNGLLDDNNIGPISFGFDFPYYWYTVNHMWIGSNGYVEFDNFFNFAHPFTSIPSTALPNNFLAPLTGDLDFNRGGTCYYYTNNVDTFIVSWLAVPPFSPPGYNFDDSVHTFQVILSGRDSSITFQYGENHGNFSESGNLADLIGIENSVGRVGIQYLRNNSPTNHMWHDGLAIKFHAIRNPSFTFHDFGIFDLFHEGSGGDFVHVGTPYTLRAIVKNFGSEPESSMVVRCRVFKGGIAVFDHSDTLGRLESDETTTVTFMPDFAPDTARIFRVNVITTLPPDQNSANNNKNGGLYAYILPQDMRYDDDLADVGRSWNGNFSGFGNEFQIPEQVVLTTASFYVNTTTAPGPGIVWVVGADQNGQPDLQNILSSDTVNVNSGFSGWMDVDISPHELGFHAGQKFFVVAITVNQTTFDIGMDNTIPLSYRGWEYTGGLAPDRYRDSSTVMIKVTAEPGTGIEEGITPKAFSLSQNYPNPFNAQTNIKFSLERPSDVTIGIYAITGQLVEKFNGFYPAGDNVVTWNAADKASGVYFYRMAVGKTVETRKMILLK